MNVIFYAFSSGKFLDVRKYACVKDLTKIMPEDGLGCEESWKAKEEDGEHIDQI